MNLSNLTIEELKLIHNDKNKLRIEILNDLDNISIELSKREKFEALKNQFSGLSAEEFEEVRNSLFLTPQSIETQEKTKI